MKQLPLISLIIPTLNNGDILEDFLKLISLQNYPKNRVELIISDGGSTDLTLKIAKKYSASIFRNKKILAEPGVSLGISKAKGEILIVLATDNFLYDTRSLLKYSETFKNADILAAFPRHESKAWDTVFTKYVNRFTDPFSHFVYGYAANGRTFKKVYRIIESNEIYDVYDFKSNKDTPLVAFAQGFAIRSKYKRDEAYSMDDIRPVIDLINEEKQLAFIHSVRLYHHTIRSLSHFVRKQRWATRNFLERRNYGVGIRRSEFSPGQQFRMKIWPFYALSFLAPLIYSVFHLLKDREAMWIWHAPMCFLSASASAYEILLYNIRRKQIVSRQA